MCMLFIIAWPESCCSKMLKFAIILGYKIISNTTSKLPFLQNWIQLLRNWVLFQHSWVSMEILYTAFFWFWIYHFSNIVHILVSITISKRVLSILTWFIPECQTASLNELILFTFLHYIIHRGDNLNQPTWQFVSFSYCLMFRVLWLALPNNR